MVFIHVWQSQHYSVAHFNCITMFEALEFPLKVVGLIRAV